jgi:hypothetical protein
MGVTRAGKLLADMPMRAPSLVIAVLAFVAGCPGKNEGGAVSPPVAPGQPTSAAPPTSAAAVPSTTVTAATATATPSVSPETSAWPPKCPAGWHGPVPMLVNQSPCPSTYTPWQTMGSPPQAMCGLNCNADVDCCGSVGFLCRDGMCKMNPDGRRAPIAPHPVEASSPTAPEAGPPKNAEAVVRAQIHPEAKHCYEEGLRSAPGMVGRVVLRVHVAPDGHVDESIVASNDGLTSSVADCIASAASRAQFEPPGELGSTISIPFNFVRKTP